MRSVEQAARVIAVAARHGVGGGWKDLHQAHCAGGADDVGPEIGFLPHVRERKSGIDAPAIARHPARHWVAIGGVDDRAILAIVREPILRRGQIELLRHLDQRMVILDAADLRLVLEHFLGEPWLADADQLFRAADVGERLDSADAVVDVGREPLSIPSVSRASRP